MILLVLLFFGGFVAGQDRPCGYTTVPQSRVIGGEDAIPGAWPWQIALLRYGRFICGGSLISANWVVTAAHCVSGDQDASSYQVVVGDHNRNVNEGTEQKIAARRIFGHPSYNRPSRLNNDIALIQLMSNASLSNRVNPICLPNNDLDILTGSKCFITGWGKIKHPGGSHHTLQQAMMPPIDQAECRRKIQETGGIVTLTPQMLCAGVKNTRLSGCHGDSGGPYVCLNADQKTYTLHGAVSWGSPTCNSSQLYTVFARVTQFLPWIKQHTEHGDGGGGSSVTTPAGSTAWSCGFEDSSICNFTQEKSDTFDWRQNKGSTSSSNTGPSSGHGGSGYYMYIETSYPRQYGDYATLISPVQKFSKIMCLTFYYHMYGSAIGNLTVSIDGEVKFFKAGNQGNQWVEAKINIDVCGDHPVIFTATRGKTYTGDIAIDDISLKQGSCTLGTTPPQLPKVLKCSFDNSTCGLKQSRNDTFDWTRHKGPTPSSVTGPSSDHSSGNGYYMYIEASSPRRQGDYAVLSSPALLSTGNTCITFYYHMYGSAMGKLTVNVNGRVLFRKSGNQGDRWILAEFDNYIVGVYKVVFNATRGSSFQSDIAIDDVIVRPGSCLSVPASSTAPPVVTASPAPVSNVIKCSFSTNSSCGFTQSRNDTFDWTRHRGITTSSSTGPSSDHTGGNGYYMYIETSSPRKQGDYAELLSPAVRFGGQTCLQFFYHMYGATIGGLLVFVDKKNLFSKIGNQGNKWLDARINISKYGVYKVSFVGVRGSSFTGDIAIDDISLRPGPCLPGPPTVQPCIPPLPASCGLRPHTRIVGGTVATPGSWPWQTMLRSLSGFQFCGGTLVSDEYVITAAHCIGSNPFQIRLGAHKRTTSVTGYEQDFNVSKVITHPLYQFPQRFSHDIAIVKLSKPAQLNRRVHPACLPLVVPAPVNGERCWITGWGRTSAGGPSPDVLLQASVPIVSRPRCDKAYPNQIHDSMICAGLDQGGIDSCQGDSGGPMVCETGGRYYLHGVTSWGHGCALPNKFGVYAKVTYRYLLDWIMSEIAKK